MTSGQALRDAILAAAPAPLEGPALTLSIADLRDDGWIQAGDKWNRGTFHVWTHGRVIDGAWFESWHGWLDSASFEDIVASSEPGAPPSSRRPSSSLLLVVAIAAALYLSR